MPKQLQQKLKTKDKRKPRKKTNLRLEVEALIQKNKDDKVTRRAIVEEGQKYGTAIHAHFEKKKLFSPDVAMYRAQMEEAGILLRQYKAEFTIVNERGQQERVKLAQFTSITTDRYKPGGGYRKTEDVFKQVELREQYLNDAEKELNAFLKKYIIIHELAGIRKGIRRLLDRIPAIRASLKVKNSA